MQKQSKTQKTAPESLANKLQNNWGLSHFRYSMPMLWQCEEPAFLVPNANSDVN
jgi:hypothetical protein